MTADTGITRVRVAVLGGGFTGLGMAIRLAQAGIDDYVVLERSTEIGGTWRDNSYPGCAVDVQSHLYSYSFAPNPEWTQVYAGQEEIWAYIRKVAREHDVLGRVRLGTEVRAGAWDEAAACWRLETGTGEVEARFVVSALGPLSTPAVPDIPGLGSFAGRVFHSARWDHQHDLTGRRVGVIGTGSSAAQFVPEIQPRVGHLTVFQRTPHWTFPRNNRRISEAERAVYRRFPLVQRVARARQFAYRELVGALIQRPGLLESVSKARMRRQVPDPRLRAALTPDYRLGCKRIIVTDDFHPALTRPNVELVTAPIREVRPHGLVTDDDVEHPLDTLILGTGFRVMTVADPLRGRHGDTLTQRWAREGRSAHLGTTVSGFPNLFLLVGPNTATGHTSVLLYAEAQIDYVLGALRHAERHGIAALDVRRGAQEAYNADLTERLAGTIWTTGGCNSWYLDAPGRTSALWPGTTWSFRRALRRFDHENYVMHRERAAARTVV